MGAASSIQRSSEVSPEAFMLPCPSCASPMTAGREDLALGAIS